MKQFSIACNALGYEVYSEMQDLSEAAAAIKAARSSKVQLSGSFYAEVSILSRTFLIAAIKIFQFIKNLNFFKISNGR